VEVAAEREERGEEQGEREEKETVVKAEV